MLTGFFFPVVRRLGLLRFAVPVGPTLAVVTCSVQLAATANDEVVVRDEICKVGQVGVVGAREGGGVAGAVDVGGCL